MDFIDLDIEFPIPSFSRSIIIPTSEIYLLGGDHQNNEINCSVFIYDPRTPAKTLL